MFVRRALVTIFAVSLGGIALASLDAQSLGDAVAAEAKHRAAAANQQAPPRESTDSNTKTTTPQKKVWTDRDLTPQTPAPRAATAHTDSRASAANSEPEQRWRTRVVSTARALQGVAQRLEVDARVANALPGNRAALNTMLATLEETNRAVAELDAVRADGRANKWTERRP